MIPQGVVVSWLPPQQIRSLQQALYIIWYNAVRIRIANGWFFSNLLFRALTPIFTRSKHSAGLKSEDSAIHDGITDSAFLGVIYEAPPEYLAIYNGDEC